MKIKNKAEEYASEYWNKNDEDYVRTFGMGDMWCHYHNSYLQGVNDYKEYILQLINLSDGDIDFLKFKIQNEN